MKECTVSGGSALTSIDLLSLPTAAIKLDKGTGFLCLVSFL